MWSILFRGQNEDQNCIWIVMHRENTIINLGTEHKTKQDARIDCIIWCDKNLSDFRFEQIMKSILKQRETK